MPSLESRPALEAALAAAREEEAAADAALAAAVAACEAELAALRAGPPAAALPAGEAAAVARARDLVAASRGELAAHAGKADGIAATVDGTRELAERVASSVRAIDSARHNAESALELAQNIGSLKECIDGVGDALQEGRFEDAARFVRQFRSIESAVPVESNDFQVMRSAQAQLAETLSSRLDGAVRKRNHEEVARYSVLFDALGQPERGRDAYVSFVARQLADAVDVDVAGARAGTLPFVELLTNVFNGTATALQQSEPLMNASFAHVHGCSTLYRELHRSCDRQASALLQRYIAERRLREMVRRWTERSAEREQQDAEQTAERLAGLDELLHEVALVAQFTESYDRFVRGRSAEVEAAERPPERIVEPVTEVNGAVQELAGCYSALENELLAASVRKAVAVFREAKDDSAGPPAAEDAAEQEEEEFARSAAAVEDCFYVAQRIAQRALATGHSASASAVVNHVGNTLAAELCQPLGARLRAQADAVDASQHALMARWGKLKTSVTTSLTTLDVVNALAGGGGGGGVSQPERLSEAPVLATINDLECAAELARGLRTSLTAGAREVFPAGELPRTLAQCLEEMGSLAGEFEQVREAGLRRAGQWLAQRVTELVQTLVGGKQGLSFDLTEDAYAANEAHDPFVFEFLHNLDRWLAPYGERLSEDNLRRLLDLLVPDVCRAVELAVRDKKFNALGGLQFDKDVRLLVHSLAARAPALRDHCARLTQIALVLNLDRPEDILDFWGERGDGIDWRLAPEDVRHFLHRRVDFSRGDVQSVPL